MKLIYMEQTLNAMAQIQGVEAINLIVAAGETRETEDKVPYLVITLQDEADGTSTT